MTKPVLSYRTAGSRARSGLPAGPMVRWCAAWFLVGALALGYSLLHDWGWDVLAAWPVGIVLVAFQLMFVAVPSTFGVSATDPTGRAEPGRWVPALLAVGAVAASVAALWHAATSAHGC